MGTPTGKLSAWRVRDNASGIANTHSTYLSPYYSSASMTSLRAKLTELVNALLNMGAQNEDE